MLDGDHDKKNEQAEAELGQAQPQRRPETKIDVDIWIASYKGIIKVKKCS